MSLQLTILGGVEMRFVEALSEVEGRRAILDALSAISGVEGSKGRSVDSEISKDM